MAFRYEEAKTSKLGKQMFKSLTGIDHGSNINLKDHILSMYKSVEDLKEKAKADQDWQAQVDLAMAYQYGVPELNIEKDLDSAIGWYESSIHGGNCIPTSILSLGTLHDIKGTVRHQRRAYELYVQAASLGSLQAASNVAEMFRCGVEGVVNEDLQEAFKWYRRAAGEEPFSDEQGDTSNPSSYLIKGTMRNLGIDAKLEALKRLHKYYMAGECPEGQPQPFKAVHYLKKAAELGDPEAQRVLGLSYLTGESGNPKDLNKAKRWLGKAANSDDQEAKQALKKLEEQGIVVQPVTDELSPISSFQQHCEILKMNVEQQQHPLVIQNPIMFQEVTFTQYPDSPTAQRYLKAFRLVKKGLENLQSSGFTDAEAIKRMALGVLYENSITQSFLYITGSSHFKASLFVYISSLLKTNPTFFEGLLLIIKLFPMQAKLNLESCKLDVKKATSLKNLIYLIKKAEPDKPPIGEPYKFEGDYSSWLHELYYHLGSLYIVTDCFKDGAQAFQEALNCCPNYFEAKLPLAYCFMNMAAKKKNKENAPNPDEVLLETFEPPENQRVPKGDYITWTEDQLRQKAKQLFMEYLQEAPECDKKYPHAHYHLALLHMLEGNMEEAVKWKEKGEDAEVKRLPFTGPVVVGSKELLAMLDFLPQNAKNKCSNKTCPEKRSGKLKLKPCPCHKASYCGSQCQSADWKEHKKICSHKKKTGTEK
ncbi:uncharacterized protein LOC116293714 [Actinia tenebrosa]|uniref:Uncharacterized protein LOC116293714 n=1 Tax=Actinia tenebrosa TaxID=6105 RepID=A0A6P8HWK2_ACTTE|nr:uncharacterized protein LOC116293714 [Actinia tenebrosa]